MAGGRHHPPAVSPQVDTPYVDLSVRDQVGGHHCSPGSTCFLGHLLANLEPGRADPAAFRLFQFGQEHFLTPHEGIHPAAPWPGDEGGAGQPGSAFVNRLWRQLCFRGPSFPSDTVPRCQFPFKNWHQGIGFSRIWLCGPKRVTNANNSSNHWRQVLCSALYVF